MQAIKRKRKNRRKEYTIKISKIEGKSEKKETQTQKGQKAHKKMKDRENIVWRKEERKAKHNQDQVIPRKLAEAERPRNVQPGACSPVNPANHSSFGKGSVLGPLLRINPYSSPST